MIRSALALTLFVSPLTAQGEWQVGGPDADFDQIQPAIDAAGPGDLIRVAWGVYEGFSVSKSVRIVGDQADESFSNGESVEIASPVTVRDIDPGQVVVLAEMRGTRERANTLSLLDCEGPVVLSRTLWQATRIERCATVQTERAVVTYSQPGEVPLTIVDSHVLMQDAVVHSDIEHSRAIHAVGSEVILTGGRFGGAFGLGPQGPIGTLENSHVLWRGGVYYPCTSGPCFAWFEMDAASTSNRIDDFATGFVVLPKERELTLLLVTPPPESLVALAFSLPATPVCTGSGALFLDPATLVPFYFEQTTALSGAVVVDLPVVDLPQRLGIPFTLQAGMLESDGTTSLSTHALVVF